jgi:hypothetical protein
MIPIPLAPAAAAALLLSGCVTTAQIADRGAEVSDAALEASEWTVCRASTVGAVLRRYGTSPERMEAWRLLCLPDLASPL